MKGIMILGTASDVGKSLIATAICRLFANEGFKVAPFKSQNMSNNSYVTMDGKEIGRAQGIQAEAAKTEATVWMNPILLKPKSDQNSEIVLLGKALETVSGRAYRDLFYEKGIETINLSLKELEKHFDVLVMEGAGSPVEMNLKDKELVNMKVAEMADVPAILVADIDRGGVFASIVGTLELLSPEERKRVKGILINKFRGDLSLFDTGIKWLEEKTGIPVLGVMPYVVDHMIDGEDSLSLSNTTYQKKDGLLDIAVVKLPYISNYSDLEPFLFEKDASVRWIKGPEDFGHPDAVIIPGTKSTIKDLQYIKKIGIADLLLQHVNGGGYIVGLCGGYQMLGEWLVDEHGSDTGMIAYKEKGLGIIPAETSFHLEKITVRTKGNLHPHTKLKSLASVEGYEIHLGDTRIATDEENSKFLLLENGKEEGYYSRNGKVIGTYMHHLFHNDEWRALWLNALRVAKGLEEESPAYIGQIKADKYDHLASEFRNNLDWEKVKEIVFQWG